MSTSDLIFQAAGKCCVVAPSTAHNDSDTEHDYDEEHPV